MTCHARWLARMDLVLAIHRLDDEIHMQHAVRADDYGMG